MARTRASDTAMAYIQAASAITSMPASIVAAIEGMAEACRALAFPVISGNVSLRSIAEGVKATAVSGSISISDTKGRVEASSTSDNVILTNLDSREVVAKSTSGNVQFTGKIHQGGIYELESFNGEVVLTLSPDSNFYLSAQTHNGALNTEFPLQLTRSTGGMSLSGSVGKGGADIRVKSFNGSVRIRKGAQ